MTKSVPELVLPVAPIAPAMMLTVVVPELPPPPVNAGAAVKTMFELFAVCEATVFAPRLMPRNKPVSLATRTSEANVTCMFVAGSGVRVTVE